MKNLPLEKLQPTENTEQNKSTVISINLISPQFIANIKTKKFHELNSYNLLQKQKLKTFLLHSLNNSFITSLQKLTILFSLIKIKPCAIIVTICVRSATQFNIICVRRNKQHGFLIRLTSNKNAILEWYTLENLIVRICVNCQVNKYVDRLVLCVKLCTK